ncbi:MAG: Mrp/NBP35 family ATP-binding protein [Kiritimatiellae bacterium]|nr:Mrp/NBP35 family ATP-binding protein [Kiritimatiellia bacterium]
MAGHECNGDCSHCAHAAEENSESPACLVRKNLARVKNSVVVMSGKGGVGKSTVAANLAAALSLAGCKVGLLDVDVHGPSIVEMLGLRGKPLMATEDGRIRPVDAAGVAVMSAGLAVSDPDAAVVWRGPMKIGVIQQFLSQVDWGPLDWLVVDVPPGTGDEPLTTCQLLPDPLGAVVVTTPQRVAAADVSRSLAFCDQLAFPVLGIVENMSGFVCPHCGKRVEVFSAGGADALAEKYDVPVLGRIPLDPRVCASGDAGVPFMASAAETPVGEAFAAIVEKLQKAADERA